MNSTDQIPTASTKSVEERLPIMKDKDRMDHLLELNAQDSMLVHSLLVLRATNNIRKNIELGYYDEMPSSEWFELMYREHIGGNSRAPSQYEYISMYEPGRNFDDPSATHRLSVVGLSMLNQTFQPKKYGQPPEGFGYHEYRRNELNMIRGNTILGVPAAILPELAEEMFKAIDEFVKKCKEDRGIYHLYELDVARISLSFSYLMDFLHLKPDGNGRTTEDVMVQLQKVCLGDIGKVRTWSQSGLRMKRVEEIVNDEYIELTKGRTDMMDNRTFITMKIREQIYQVLNEIFTKAGLKQHVEPLTDELLIEHSDLVLKVFLSMIRGVVENPIHQITFTVEDFGHFRVNLLDLLDLLFKSTPMDTNGDSYRFVEVDFYKSHIGADGLWERIEQVRQKQNKIEERILNMSKKITDKASAVTIFSRFVERLNKELNDNPDNIIEIRFAIGDLLIFLFRDNIEDRKEFDNLMDSNYSTSTDFLDVIKLIRERIIDQDFPMLPEEMTSEYTQDFYFKRFISSLPDGIYQLLAEN